MDASPQERFRIALELHRVGVELLRQKLRRKKPRLSARAIEEEVKRWLQERPGAEHGDAEGRPRPMPRAAQRRSKKR